MQLYYSPDYVGSAHSFDTTRKAQWIAESLTVRRIAGVDLRQPAALSIDDALRVHHGDYVDAVRSGTP